MSWRLLESSCRNSAAWPMHWCHLSHPGGSKSRNWSKSINLKRGIGLKGVIGLQVDLELLRCEVGVCVWAPCFQVSVWQNPALEVVVEACLRFCRTRHSHYHGSNEHLGCVGYARFCFCWCDETQLPGSFWLPSRCLLKTACFSIKHDCKFWWNTKYIFHLLFLKVTVKGSSCLHVRPSCPFLRLDHIRDQNLERCCQCCRNRSSEAVRPQGRAQVGI